MADQKGLSDRFATLVVKHPWMTLLAGFVVFALLLPGAAFIRTNFTYTNFFFDDDPVREVFDDFQERFGADSAIGFVVYSPSGIFDEDTTRLIQDLTDETWKIPAVVRVDSLANFQWVHADGEDLVVEEFLGRDRAWDPASLAERERIALNHEMMPYWLINRDATTTMVIGLPKPEVGGVVNDPGTITKAAQALAAKYDGQGDHEIHVVGQMALQWAFEDASIKDGTRLMPVVLLVGMVFLMVALRSIRAAIPPLVVMSLAVTSTMTALGWLGVEIGSFTAILPQIMIAISLAGSVHMSSTFVAARRRGVPQERAAHYAIESNFWAELMTSTTSSVGFLSFMGTPIANMSDFGFIGAVGIMLSWVFVVLVLAPLLVLVPLQFGVDKEVPEIEPEPSPTFLRYAAAVNRYRRPMLGAFTAISLVGLALASRVAVDSDPWNYFVKGYWCRDGNDFAIEHMDGAVIYEVAFDSGKADGIKDPEFLRRVEAFEEKIVALDGIQQTVSIVDIIKATNRSLHGDDPAYFVLPDTQQGIGQQLLLYSLSLPQGMDLNRQVTVDYDALRVSVVANFTGSTLHNAHAEKMVEIARDLGLNAVVTGKLNLYQFMIHYVVSSFVTSLATGLVLVMVCMGLFLRSPYLAVIAIIPNVAPLMVSGGIMYLAGRPLDIGTLAVGSVCLGIAVDDTVHVLSHFHHYLQRDGVERAVARVMTHTTPALVTNTLMLSAAFGAFGFGVFVPNVWFGILTAVCLLIAVATDLTVTPALLLEVYKSHKGAKPGASE